MISEILALAYRISFRKHARLEKKQHKQFWLYPPVVIAKTKPKRERDIDTDTISLLMDIADLKKHSPSVISTYECTDLDTGHLKLNVAGLIQDNLLTNYKLGTVITQSNITIIKKDYYKSVSVPDNDKTIPSEEGYIKLINPCQSDYTGLTNQPKKHRTRKFVVRAKSKSVGITPCQFHFINRYRVIDKVLLINKRGKNGNKVY